MLNRSTIPWTGKTLHSQVSKGILTFDNPIQRGFVWDKHKKSLLINSMLSNYPIPPLMFSRTDGHYDVLDGKQRSNAIYGYINGDYALVNTPLVKDDSDVLTDFNGKTFDQLPEWAQDRIKDYSLSINYYDEISQDDINEIFYRINNGKSLTSVQTIRAKARSFEEFRELANTNLMQNCFTKNAKAAFNDELVVMQAYTMCFAKEPDFRAKFFRPYIQDVEVTKDQKDKLKNAMEFVRHAFTLFNADTDDGKRMLKKLKKRTHLVCCIWLANYIQDKMSGDDFAKVITDFYSSETGATKSEAYNQSCDSGSSTYDAIRCRMEVLQKLVD
jgi:hypothetical protein